MNKYVVAKQYNYVDDFAILRIEVPKFCILEGESPYSISSYSIMYSHLPWLVTTTRKPL